MSGMHKFIHGRNGQTSNLQNGTSSIKPNRRVVAANARIPMKAHISRPPPATGPPTREEGLVRQQSVPAKEKQAGPLQRRPSGESVKPDPWDTDAESIDTTIDHSVVQSENSRRHEQQRPEHNIEESEAGDNGADGSDEIDEEEEIEFDSDVDTYLAQHDLANATRKQQIQFLQDTQPHLFATIEGDSYPTTTDGNPTEWSEQHQPSYEGIGSPALSSKHLAQDLNIAPSYHQSRQGSVSDPLRDSATVPQNSSLWQQGAQIRVQQRNGSAVQAGAQPGQLHDAAVLLISQPPTYSQAIDEHGLSAPQAAQVRAQGIIQLGRSGSPSRHNRETPGSTRIQNLAPETMEPVRRLETAPTLRDQDVPIIQQHVVPPPVMELPVFPEVDYNREALSNMKFDELRDESFDKDPRGIESILTEEMADKPLPERLQFVQHEFGPAEQASFFGSLPTDEWEEAGDWFLDQFSAIIKKTKEARKNKRNAAQGFEQEIERRHQHVTKKQRLVEAAMARMQTQGEGLVPNSPRASQTTRPRRN